MLLMPSCVIFSQNITRDSVTIVKTSAIKIYKELRKCDSLKVAYSEKTKELNDIVNANLTMFRQLEMERSKRLRYEMMLKKAEKEILKQSKKSNNNLLFGIGGGVTVLIIGILIK